MKVTVIVQDHVVVVDGLPFYPSPFPAAAAGVRVIQWSDGSGRIEFTDREPAAAEVADVQPFIDAWNASKAAADTAAAAAAAALAARTPAQLRSIRYKLETDPMLEAIQGYDLELELATDQAAKDAVAAKRGPLVTAWAATKAAIRAEIPG